ncbi:halocyanin domain-containing protein [Haloplanus aerogenes]|uniref:Halocyanin domain-containing protein n=1 Tax=Haloplanus aerogenes TaxID=660522 RepID=A0A3M0CTI6_9EURY|nr:halocyanin domain-containing protein [Haloplanus aerogenes]AZH26554.1 halocyanin domain-containing protein [Haloplanus aerogenes]RMB12782.1 halocyanin-like protein [Haloplanus aerogenes]
MTDERTRRTVLRLAVGAGLVGLAGCLTPRRQPRPGGGGDGGSGARGTPHSPGSGPHDQQGTGRHGGQHGSPMGPHGSTTRRGTQARDGDSADQWLADVDNFDGVVDRTNRSTVTVRVGAAGNGGYYAFEPPAVRVSRGTTVEWTWTGEGGAHDVVARDGSFESDLTASADATFSHTFATTGTYPYYCTPHRSLGMKGIVVVV